MISNSNYLENIYTCSFKKNGWVFFFHANFEKYRRSQNLCQIFYVHEEVPKFDKLT